MPDKTTARLLDAEGESMSRKHIEGCICVECELLSLTTLHPAAEWTEADGVVLWRVIPSDRLPLAADIAEMLAGSQQRAHWDDRYPYWSRIPKVDLPKEAKEAK